MNLRVIFAACTIAAFGSSMMTFDALSQKQSLKEQLVGTWTLLSWEQKKGDGTKVERYGTSPKGIAFFDAGGRYIITVMRSDRAKYANNALWQGTSDGRSWTGEWRPYGLTKQAEQFRYLLLRPELEAQPHWTHHETLSVDKQSEIYPFLNSDSRKEWRRRGQHLKRKLPTSEG